jgi:uncharacterized membrane protein
MLLTPLLPALLGVASEISTGDLTLAMFAGGNYTLTVGWVR